MWIQKLARASLFAAAFLGSPLGFAQTFTDAQNNFLSRSDSINHPNCLSNPLPAPAGTVLAGDASFPVLDNHLRTINVQLQVWRVRCPDNSSEILMRFENRSNDATAIPYWSGILLLSPDQRLGVANLYEIPQGDGASAGPQALYREWGLLGATTSQSMVLKLDTQLPNEVTRADLQGRIIIGFYLGELHDNDRNPLTPPDYDVDDIFVFELPSHAEMNSVAQFPLPPLTGRHSGSWVVENTADQGIVMSINELPDRRLIATMGWFTYDGNGNRVWYTGSAFFNRGDNAINFNLTTIENGHFQSAQGGNRRSLGAASIRVENCERLAFSYDLRSVGLDQRTVVLRRLFEGEIAGYPCRALSDRN